MCDRIAIIQNGKLIDVEEVSETKESYYYVEASPLDEVESLLLAEAFTVERLAEGFIINAEKEQIPALIQRLAAEGIQLFAVNPHRKTLEDQFLEMTGGGQIAEAHTK